MDKKKMKRTRRFMEYMARKSRKNINKIKSNCIRRAKFSLWLKEAGMEPNCPPRKMRGSRLNTIRIWRMRHTTNKLYEFGFALVELGLFSSGTGGFSGGN